MKECDKYEIPRIEVCPEFNAEQWDVLINILMLYLNKWHLAH